MARTDVFWAGELVDVTGNANAGWALGPPDGDEWPVGVRESATFSGWRRASYDGFEDLLARALPVGDVPDPGMLRRADLIAWELNGTEPATHGGWESCRWLFSDGSRSGELVWDVHVADASARDPRIIANGSVTGADYAAFFGIPLPVITQFQPTFPASSIVISFLLLRLRDDVDVLAPGLRVHLENLPSTADSPQNTPDVDAIGVLRHEGQLDPTPVRPRRGQARAVRELATGMRGAREPVMPVFAALWERRQAGLSARNDFEERLYDVLNRMDAATHDAMGKGFGLFAKFRDLRIDKAGLFDLSLADALGSEPLDQQRLLDKVAGYLAPVAAERLFPGSRGVQGPGKARPWQPPPGFKPPDAFVAPQLPVGPWPWLTAIRVGGAGDALGLDDSGAPVSLTDYGNRVSLHPHPGPDFPFAEPHFAHLPIFTVDAQGMPHVDRFERLHPPPPSGPPGGFVTQVFCEGGPDYTVGNDCLYIPEQAVGTTFRVRGFNLTTAQVTVHLRREDDPNHPVRSISVPVWGDQDTPVTQPDGTAIADARVRDWIEVPIPREDPLQTGFFFPSGLYGVWITLLDETDPAAPVVRTSNALLVRLTPAPDARVSLSTDFGHCVLATPGFGDDEIWWTANVARIRLTEAGHSVTADVFEPRTVVFPREPWSDTDTGDDIRFPAQLLLGGPLPPNDVFVAAVLGLEIDSEEAAEKGIRDFGEAFSQGLMAMLGVVLAGGAFAGTVIDVAYKIGVLTASTAGWGLVALGVAVVIAFVSLAFWAAWAAPDLIAIDTFSLDNHTVTDLTDPLKPLPPRVDRRQAQGDTVITSTQQGISKTPTGPGTADYRFEIQYNGDEAVYQLQYLVQRSSTA